MEDGGRFAIGFVYIAMRDIPDAHLAFLWSKHSS